MQDDEFETSPDQELDSDQNLSEPQDDINYDTPENDLDESEPVEDVPTEPPFVTWETPEYVSGEKGPGWYIGLFVIAAACIALDIFFLKAYLFTAVIVLATIAIILYSRNTPRLVACSLDSRGLTIDNKLHLYSSFRSFGILDDGKRFSLVLIPKKRFSPGVSVYIPEDLGEQIVDIFGQRIPMEEVKQDFIDRLIKRLGI